MISRMEMYDDRRIPRAGAPSPGGLGFTNPASLQTLRGGILEASL